ncbi:MAG: type II toxin-antitoxin system Phd/YefM family antitoxin [Propioniciclava sp.]|uniref:type II toxin-antitoxin system Phd/YefM family antitoxin n=1 Tax=Propioniciclava sp. TaxID=2038686 RepID=UPI0039E37299
MNSDHTWPMQDAKARFIELIDACLTEGPQVVTRHGQETAVVISIAEWRQLHHDASPPLKQLLLSDEARTDDLTPARGQARRRSIPVIR